MSRRKHNRDESRTLCCATYQADERHRAELSHDAACDWLDDNPFPCGGDVDAHLERCRAAVSQRLGFFDPGSLLIIWNVLSILWKFYDWLTGDDNTAV